MQALYELISNVKVLDTNKAFQIFFTPEQHRARIVALNTWGQLYDRGVDAHGIPLGYYRPYTLKRKNYPIPSHGQITLIETGDFYRSFQATVHYGAVDIDANTMKGTDDLMDIHGEILGLDEESKGELTEYMIENDFTEIIKQQILVNI